ncbi:hypothetical protein GQR58_023128 [Nymphon striatum]|nr:hypothetical protein GQR58_023128 [Nymphon striatum]
MLKNRFCLGLMQESRQWVDAIAIPNNMESGVAAKERRGDLDVVIDLPQGDYQGRNMVLVDDVASSGQTLIQAAKQLKQYQPASISVLVTHALFMQGSIEELRSHGELLLNRRLAADIYLDVVAITGSREFPVISAHGKAFEYATKRSLLIAIEFNENLRWIDVISEIAFLKMDLQDRKQESLANRFLNAYLEITGDYQGLAVLSFYLCYRAMVRAKVDALRIEQSERR